MQKDDDDRNKGKANKAPGRRGSRRKGGTSGSRTRHQPHNLDVLLGRGHSLWPGNIRYRQIISTHVQAYNSAKSNKDKTSITKSIISEIRDGGGRFLREDSNTGELEELDDESVRFRVGQALRHQLRTSVDRTESKSLSPSSSPTTLLGETTAGVAAASGSPSQQMFLSSFQTQSTNMMHDSSFPAGLGSGITPVAASQLGNPLLTTNASTNAFFPALPTMGGPAAPLGGPSVPLPDVQQALSSASASSFLTRADTGVGILRQESPSVAYQTRVEPNSSIAINAPVSADRVNSSLAAPMNVPSMPQPMQEISGMMPQNQQQYNPLRTGEGQRQVPGESISIIDDSFLEEVDFVEGDFSSMNEGAAKRKQS